MSGKSDFQIIKLPFKSKTDLLACGAELKNTFCLVKGDKLFKSGNNGDLENLDNLLGYERGIGAALKRLNLQPRLVCCDMHPEYLSTKFGQEFAKKYPAGLEFIQHHHAHVASCMLENKEKGKAIGVAFDGTGFGSDGKLWGAEFLIFDYKNFKRQAHLRYIPLAGGNKPILEPWRLAATWLYAIYKDQFLDLKIDFVKKIDREKWQIIKQMLDKNINSPFSSSMGRLFDAVSALIGVRSVVEYEAQAAIELERLASKFYSQDVGSYKFTLARPDGWIINPGAIFSGIIQDLKNRQPIGKIALKFHYTVCRMISEVCILIRQQERLNRVFLSGGVFQNKIITEKSTTLLQAAGFKVFKSPTAPNDGCISIGQAMVGLARHKRV